MPTCTNKSTLDMIGATIDAVQLRSNEDTAWVYALTDPSAALFCLVTIISPMRVPLQRN